MPIKAVNTAEPILGYTLKERIGSGGYGEVWVAEAPGGLSKAIKFIYGYHDENRAQRELKALNRIKEVRHPFLLSLERIDVVDGQMVVITELADMSLKDRFDESVESGLNGIPRAELMGYMRDAADALDYISEEHRLQHLDVKPENLLLVSGHIKVGDYGLVKDIHDGTQSLMGGLTPAFAPPELFDGRPSKASDQYSLAIVFQEMLTGQRPFDGTTAAQLASQHMQERPRLTSLPRDDQGVIARSLSKDPVLRFPSCRAMVDQLSDQISGARTRSRKSLPKRKGKSRVTQTADATLRLPDGSQPLAMRPAEVTKLPPVDCDAGSSKTRPTLFLGIGHTGTYILRQLRRRLRDRIGAAESTPAIRLLSLDTDRRDLAAACRGESPDVLSDSETFALPLRRSDEYRSDAKMHLAWLSRRWIYNVPRSLQTEGIRPLGRLAFADHHVELFVRMRQVLSDLVRQESLAETAETLGMDPIEHPRVYVIGSISGGTCSGMAIDVAYALRCILQELGVPDDDLIGVFTHAARRNATDRELAVANSLAFLSELYHFSRVEDYPGDETCGLPEFTDQGPTFDSTYLVHFGDELVQREYDEITNSIAEYLYLSTASRCASFFDASRLEETDERGLALRTLGVSWTGGVGDQVLVESADLLCHQLVQSWLGNVANGTDFGASDFAAKHCESLGISTEKLVQRVQEIILAMHVDPVAALAQQMTREFNPEDRQQSIDRVRETADQFFRSDSETDGKKDNLQDALERVQSQFQENVESEFSKGILALVDDPQLRLHGAERGFQAVTDQLRKHQQQLEQLRSATAERRQDCEAKMTVIGSPAEEPENLLNTYAQLCLQLFTLDGVLSLFRTLTPLVEKTKADLDSLQRRLQIFGATYHRAKDASQTDTKDLEETDHPAAKFAAQILEHLQRRLPKLVDRVDQHLQHGLLDTQGGLGRVLAGEQMSSQLGQPLEQAARMTVVEELKETNLDQFVNGGDKQSCRELVRWLNMAALPRLLRCGGSTRLLLAIPEKSQATAIADEFRQEFDQIPCVIAATAGELVTCYEVEQLPLNNITMTLLQDRPEALEFASRLHARTDVEWSPLTAIR